VRIGTEDIVPGRARCTGRDRHRGIDRHTTDRSRATVDDVIDDGLVLVIDLTDVTFLGSPRPGRPGSRPPAP
jgi:hypothetical protein